MEGVSHALVVIAALWASISAIINCSKMLNESRNIVLTGTIDGQQIPVRLRKMVLWSDWFSWIIFAGFAAFVFAVLLLVLAFFTADLALTYACRLVASVPVLFLIGLAVFGTIDFAVMQRLISDSETASSDKLLAHSAAQDADQLVTLFENPIMDQKAPKDPSSVRDKPPTVAPSEAPLPSSSEKQDQPSITAPAERAESAWTTTQKALIAAAIAIALNPISVIFGFLLNQSLPRPDWNVSYVNRAYTEESDVPDVELTKAVLANTQLRNLLRNYLEDNTRTREADSDTRWLDGEPLTSDLLPRLERTGTLILESIQQEVEAAKDNLDRIARGVTAEEGIRPMRLIRPEIFTLNPDSMAPVLKGQITEAEAMRKALDPWVKTLRNAIKTSKRNGDVELTFGILNSGSADGVIENRAKLTFDHGALWLATDSYVVVKAHSFVEITFTIGGADDPDSGDLKRWRNAVKRDEGTPFKVVLKSGKATIPAAGRL